MFKYSKRNKLLINKIGFQIKIYLNKFLLQISEYVLNIGYIVMKKISKII